MIVVDSNNEIWTFLDKSKLSDQISVVRLDQDSFELSSGLDEEVILAHTDILKSEICVSKLNRCFSTILFGDENTDFSTISSVVFFLKKNETVSLFKNLVNKLDSLSREQQVFKSQMLTINNELTEVMGNVEVELLKIKKIYEAKAPKRMQSYKGLHVYSKYSAGESIGGEFFDFYKDKHKLLVIMSSTNSYLVSSSILSLFCKLKEESHINEGSVASLYSDICHDAVKINETKSKKVSLELCLFVLDLNELTLDGKVHGDFSIKSSDMRSLYEYNTKGKYFDELEDKDINLSAKLERGKRLLISSPGFNKNWKKLEPKFLKEQLLANNKIKTLDILDEAFFQLKKDSKNGFLSHDASAIILEVDDNAIFKA